MTLLRIETERLLKFFQAAGAERVETNILQQADVLLDLYGEDIRGRAFVTSDPLHGEQMLRPDFTVPIVQRHMAESAEPARYTYAGKVFRRQETGADRASEIDQVGYEVFDRGPADKIEAEVFGIFYRVLAPFGLTASTGDVGLLLAAIEGLTTSQARKEALRRHIWRPHRFGALIERFSNIVGVKGLGVGGQQIGLRDAGDIKSRLAQLAQEAEAPPIPRSEVNAIKDLLAVRNTFPNALEDLENLAPRLPSIESAIVNMHKRASAFTSAGINIYKIGFEAAYGLTAMEYYDGFVFGFYSPEQFDWPAVASGGRYDALTRVLGQGRSVPAVGGIVRPHYTQGLLQGAIE